MISTIRKLIARNHTNYLGWRTPRKIIVIESDDWGSIRMPNYGVYKTLEKKNINIEKCPYARYDSLASEDDLLYLFETLTDYYDHLGNHPVITANTVMTNPDFIKIEQSGFAAYHNELFTQTLQKYPKHQNSFKLWEKAIEESIFYPQFHGREHVNIKLWLSLLNDKTSLYREVFQYNLWGLVQPVKGSCHKSVQASYDAENYEDILEHEAIISDGLRIFQSIFDFESKSFIANNFIYHSDLNQPLCNYGVRYIQGMKYQILPLMGKKKREMIRHYIGEMNEFGQHYLVRNCVFEPSQFPYQHDNVGECLKGIRNAFLWNKPAIITTHRLNFIGYIHPDNRERNLKQFRELLVRILKKWPDVEFMTSVELGDLIATSNQDVLSRMDTAHR